MRATWVLVLVVLVGCGGSAKPPTAPPEPEPKQESACVPMATHVIGVIVAEREKYRGRAPAMIEAVRVRCEQDRWTAENIQCMASAKTRDDSQVCFKALTKAQQDALEAVEDAGKQPAGATIGAKLETEMTAWKTKTCACKDKACADMVWGEYRTWMKTQRDVAKDISEAEIKTLMAIEDDSKACRNKLRDADAGAAPVQSPAPSPSPPPARAPSKAMPPRKPDKAKGDPCQGGE